MNVELQNTTDHTDLPTEAVFNQWAEKVTSNLQLPTSNLEATIRLINAEESNELNRQFRNKDKATNVLSFPYEPLGEEDKNYLGDLAMCVDVIKLEAQEQNKTLEAHFTHMTIHGILHLLGYDHIEEDQAKAMEALEIKILAELGFENPYT